AFPARPPKLRLKEHGRLRHHPEQPLPFAGRLLIARRLFQPDTGPLGQLLPGFPERERPGAHDEVEDVPAGMTAEAVEEAALRIDGERRGLLRVERAEALVVAAGPAQGDVRGYDIQNIDPAPDLVGDLPRSTHSTSIVRPARPVLSQPGGPGLGQRRRGSPGRNEDSVALLRRTAWTRPARRPATSSTAPAPRAARGPPVRPGSTSTTPTGAGISTD